MRLFNAMGHWLMTNLNEEKAGFDTIPIKLHKYKIYMYGQVEISST